LQNVNIFDGRWRLHTERSKVRSLVHPPSKPLSHRVFCTPRNRRIPHLPAEPSPSIRGNPCNLFPQVTRRHAQCVRAHTVPDGGALAQLETDGRTILHRKPSCSKTGSQAPRTEAMQCSIRLVPKPLRSGGESAGPPVSRHRGCWTPPFGAVRALRIIFRCKRERESRQPSLRATEKTAILSRGQVKLRTGGSFNCATPGQADLRL